MPKAVGERREEVTDEELIKAVAVEVMGWTHFELDGKGRYSKTNYAYIVDRDGSRLSDGYWEIEWLPLTNANHWMMVVERMMELGWWFYADPNPHYYPKRHGEISYDIGFFKIKCEKRLAEVCGCEKITGEFVCQAALKAVKGGL